MTHKSKLLMLALLVVATIFVGIYGYVLIEGWSWSDAIYMTAITLTTTGYGEVNELTHSGRIFTILLMLLGIGTFAYGTSTFFAILSINLPKRRLKRMQKRISALREHAIVLGYGRMGSTVAQMLHDAGYPFVVIERRDELVELLKETKYRWLEGDAANDEILSAAGVKYASYLVSTVDDDADGLFATIATKALNPDIQVIVRANNVSTKKKMLIAGADRVILPFRDSGQTIAHSILEPEVKATLDLSSLGAENEFLEFINIEIDGSSPLLGKNLGNCGVKREGFMVIGIRRNNKSFEFAPSADETFNVGDTLVAVCTKDTYKATMESVGYKQSS